MPQMRPMRMLLNGHPQMQLEVSNLGGTRAQEDEGNGSGGTKKPIGQDKAEDYGTQWGGDGRGGSMAF